MLALHQIEELEAQLAELPALVDKLTARDAAFERHAEGWIRQLEQLLERHRQAPASDIALLRAELALTSLAGNSAPGGRRGRRMERLKTAGDVVRRAGELVSGFLQESRSLMSEGHRVARQMAAVARVKGLLHPGDRDWAGACADWDAVSADPDLISPATHLVGLVGRGNAILLFLRSQAEI